MQDDKGRQEEIGGWISGVKQGKESRQISVRDLLAKFGAQRRGYWIVTGIRAALERRGLQTNPDFESAYLDSTVDIVDMPTGETGKATPVTALPAMQLSSPVIGSPVSEIAAVNTDPTFRVSKLAAANNPPMPVTPDAPLSEAVTLMLQKDFSQLPVMTTEREVKGVISWASIAARLALGTGGSTGSVRDFMDRPFEIASDSSMFDAIPIVATNGYVLVRNKEKKVTGIVTASDLNLQFQQLAEPFLLLAEIENHIRRFIQDKFTPDELKSARDPNDTDRDVAGIEDLTFGEYVRLLQNQTNWTKMGTAIDKDKFCCGLDRIRDIRNDVMHFDPDGIPDADLETLRRFSQFLQRLQEIGVS